MAALEKAAEGGPLFLLRHISRVFGTFCALSGIDLEIRAGECLLIAGSNGSGKSVLMRIIAGLLEPSGGEILHRGRPLNPGSLHRELGLVFQDSDAQIVGETVAEDVAFGPKNLGLSKTETARRVDGALAAFGLGEKRDFPPRRLSGGEKRRLAAAGVIAMEVETVIMDEPFANLDWPGVVQTLETVMALKRAGKTVIILTHELEKVLALTDRLVILHRGIIRADGKPEEVLNGLDPQWGVRDPRHGCSSAAECSWLPA
jgi:biotin transport system ATP-binding protein